MSNVEEKPYVSILDDIDDGAGRLYTTHKTNKYGPLIVTHRLVFCLRGNLGSETFIGVFSSKHNGTPNQFKHWINHARHAQIETTREGFGSVLAHNPCFTKVKASSLDEVLLQHFPHVCYEEVIELRDHILKTWGGITCLTILS